MVYTFANLNEIIKYSGEKTVQFFPATEELYINGILVPVGARVEKVKGGKIRIII